MDLRDAIVVEEKRRIICKLHHSSHTKEVTGTIMMTLHLEKLASPRCWVNGKGTSLSIIRICSTQYFVC